MSLLLIDDEPAVLRSVSRLLQMKLGYTVVQAKNLAEAEQALAEHADIQVILSDIEIGKGADKEYSSNFYLKHKEMIRNRPIAFVVQTGGAPAYVLAVFDKHGIQVLTKPSDADTIQAAIQAAQIKIRHPS